MSAEIEVEVDVICSVRVKVMLRDENVSLKEAKEQARGLGLQAIKEVLTHLPATIQVACSPTAHSRGLKATA